MRCRFTLRSNVCRQSRLHGRAGAGPLGHLHSLTAVSDVTQILHQIEQGDAHAAGQLLPLVYDELRRLAARNVAQERAGQTLQATALVHEDYLRLVSRDPNEWKWDRRLS